MAVDYRDMRNAIGSYEYIVNFSYPNGKEPGRIGGNGSFLTVKTRCEILVGPVGSKDETKTVCGDMIVYHKGKKKFNLAVAREYAMRNALTDSRIPSADAQILWDNRTIRRSGCEDLADVSF